MRVARSSTLLPVVLLAACGAAACTEMAAPATPSPIAELATESAGQVSGDDQSALAAVRGATAAFHDVGKAVAAGYGSPVGGHCDQMAMGAMGVHTPNPALMQNQALVPESPEILLYLPTGGGNYRLVGVEYFQTLLLRDTTTGVVAPWFSAGPWPSQYVVVNPAPSLFGQTFQGPMAGHVPGMPWHYDLHVWAWAPNPSGLFEQWNPSISCP
jgi:hypothetical protein